MSSHEDHDSHAAWDAPEADRLRIAVCACPDVHIVLLDADGNGLARFTMDPEMFERAVTEALAHVAAFRAQQGDTIGNVAGSA